MTKRQNLRSVDNISVNENCRADRIDQLAIIYYYYYQTVILECFICIPLLHFIQRLLTEKQQH